MSREGAPCPPETFRALLAGRAPAFRLALGEDSLGALARFLGELDRWRRIMDLTGRLSPEDLSVHALESIVASDLLPAGATVLDVGSGSGFPGVPLAIARPDLRVAALEPRAKRAEFLRHVARAVPVDNLSVLQSRVEAQGAGLWDGATVRAVGNLRETLRGAPFLRDGGVLLVWTTDAQKLRPALAPELVFEEARPVSGSSRRVVAVFRRAPGESSQPTTAATFHVERRR